MFPMSKSNSNTNEEESNVQESKVWMWEKDAEWADAWDAYDAACAVWRRMTERSLDADEQVRRAEHELECARAAAKEAAQACRDAEMTKNVRRGVFHSYDADRDLAFFNRKEA